MLYQHGDVLIKKASKIPEAGKKVEKTGKGYILAEGEVTGHYHAVQDEIQLIEKDGVLYIKASDKFTITHEEHKPITIPAGDYEVGRVSEYDHFSEEARKVAD